MKIQEYLSNKTIDDLKIELGITATYHDKLPIMILNYSQIDSPKTNDIVRECRALVLNKNDYILVAKSFDRFFNWGEVQEESHLFRWDDFICNEKEDGSLVMFYKYDGNWTANTRSSFGGQACNDSGKSWNQIIVECIGNRYHFMDGSITYIFELVGPANRVVRSYDKQELILLSMFRGEQELPFHEVKQYGIAIGFKTPYLHQFKNMDEVREYLNYLENNNPTHEGVVIRDCNNFRWKIKNKKYLELHKIWGAGGFANSKNLLPFILSGDYAELLTYFPELKNQVYELKSMIEQEYNNLVVLWESTKDIADQKEFALSIIGKTPFTGILFNARKRGEQIKDIWNKSEQLISKQLFTKDGE